MNIFSPKGFLQVGGFIFILLALAGYIGVLGSTAGASIFGSTWWFDKNENIIYLVLGLLSFLMLFLFPAMWQRYFVLSVGIVSVLVGLYNIRGNNTMLLGLNLESPADLVFHLVIGVWALYAVFNYAAKKVPA